MILILQSFAIFFEWLKEINLMIEDGSLSRTEASKSLNFVNFCDFIFQVIPNNQEIPEKILQYAKLRELARKKKDWTEADMLRKKIDLNGWRVEDSSKGFQAKEIIK